MVINSCKEIDSIVTDLDRFLGKYFNKRQLKKLSKYIVGKGEVSVYKVSNSVSSRNDALYIKDIVTNYSNSVNTEIDKEYDVIVGNSLIPGYLNSLRTIHNGKISYRNGKFINAIVGSENYIIFKSKELSNSRQTKTRQIVYAIVN